MKRAKPSKNSMPRDIAKKNIQACLNPYMSISTPIMAGPRKLPAYMNVVYAPERDMRNYKIEGMQVFCSMIFFCIYLTWSDLC